MPSTPLPPPCAPAVYRRQTKGNTKKLPCDAGKEKRGAGMSSRHQPHPPHLPLRQWQAKGNTKQLPCREKRKAVQRGLRDRRVKGRGMHACTHPHRVHLKERRKMWDKTSGKLCVCHFFFWELLLQGGCKHGGLKERTGIRTCDHANLPHVERCKVCRARDLGVVYEPHHLLLCFAPHPLWLAPRQDSHGWPQVRHLLTFQQGEQQMTSSEQEEHESTTHIWGHNSQTKLKSRTECRALVFLWSTRSSGRCDSRWTAVHSPRNGHVVVHLSF